MSTYRSFRDMPNRGSGPPRPSHGPPGRAGPPQDGFDWQRYLEKGYFQPNGQIWPELITTTAHTVGGEFVKGRVTAHQLNRMFRKAAALQQKVASADIFDSLTPDILAFLPDAAYQAGRDQVNLPLKHFLDKNIPLATKDKEHFVKGFYRHFVSVYQWYVWESKQVEQQARR